MKKKFTHQFIRFEIGSQAYCVNMANLNSVQRRVKLIRDGQNKQGYGWLKLNHQKIPVIASTHFFGVSKNTPMVDSPILVFDLGDRLLGLMVDRVHQIFQPEPDQIMTMPDAWTSMVSTVYQGVVAFEKNFLLWLAPEKLEEKEEWEEAQAPGPRTGPPKMPHTFSNRKPMFTLFNTGNRTGGNKPIHYGISISQVGEILELPKVTVLPRSREDVIGMVAWRNKPLPIIDLDKRLSLGGFHSTGSARLLVTRTTNPNEYLGIKTQSNLRIQTETSNWKPSRRHHKCNLHFVMGIYEGEKDVVIFPDLDKLIYGTQKENLRSAR